MIRLYFDRGAEEIHIGTRNSGETYCGAHTRGLRLLGTINEPEAFTPEPDSIHDACLTEFDQRHGLDRSSNDQNTGWVDMRE